MKTSHKRSEKGETGIGTLIVFIALVLVAAIAASVLLGTSSSLQQRALTTGKQTEREVSGGLGVVLVSAANITNGTFYVFELVLKLSAGSDPIALDDLVITMDTKNTSQSFQYYTNSSQGANTTHYNISYQKYGSEYKAGYLSRGDMLKITYVASRPIGESELVKNRLVPKHGIIVPVDFFTPDVMTQDRVVLYP